MEPAEAEVTLEDQQNINLFGRLNNRLHFLDDELKKNKEAVDSLEDASNEIILVDDNESLRCLWGEAYLHLPKEDLEGELEARKERLLEAKGEMEKEKRGVVGRMGELKRVLYRKFGDSINLEEE